MLRRMKVGKTADRVIQLMAKMSQRVEKQVIFVVFWSVDSLYSGVFVWMVKLRPWLLGNEFCRIQSWTYIVSQISPKHTRDV